MQRPSHVPTVAQNVLRRPYGIIWRWLDVRLSSSSTMHASLRSTSARPLPGALARTSPERRSTCSGARAGPVGIRGSSRCDQGRALVARSEIWWAEHPDAGRRPFLVLTRQAAIPVLNALLAVPATRTIRQIPTEVVLDIDDGMP